MRVVMKVKWPKWLTIFLKGLFIFNELLCNSLVLGTTTESIITLPSTMIEGEIHDMKSAPVESSFMPRHEIETPISVKSGLGSKNMDPQFNELGVPYFNMNNDLDLTLERELSSLWLLTSSESRLLPDSKNYSNSNIIKIPNTKLELITQQFHFEVSEDFPIFRAKTSKFKTKSQSQSNSKSESESAAHSEEFKVEIGTSSDRRWYQYRNQIITPTLSDHSKIEKLRSKNDQSYFKISDTKKEQSWMLDGDTVNRDVHLGSALTGYSKMKQVNMNSRWQWNQDYTLYAFLKNRSGDFESQSLKNDSNQFQNRQLGVLLKWNAPLASQESPAYPATEESTMSPESVATLESTAFQRSQATQSPHTSQQNPVESSIKLGLSNENLQRDYTNQSQTELGRYQLEFIAIHKQQWNYFSAKEHFKSQAAKDFTRKSFSQWNSASNQSLLHHQQQELSEPLTFDIGVEISTLSKPDRFWNLGFKGQLRRYSLLPTPTQKLGDGMSLSGNEDLPPEEGTRVASGLWFEATGIEAELLPFFEQTLNEPVILATTPQSAKTLGLGSVYVQGVEFHLKRNFDSWNLDFLYSYQEALNNSKISWQRGQALPGRPTHYIDSTFIYGKWNQGLTFGITYGFKSEEALDLSGLWKRAPHHNLKSFIGYGTSAWAVQVVGSQLLSSLNESPLSLQQGMVGYDLMDPKIETQEFKLLCEFFL